jgi:acetyl esterase/lipase
MRRPFLRRFGLLAVLALAGSARGGPLADLLRERKAAREGNNDGGPSEGGVGKRSFTPPEGISVERDVAYGSDAAQRIDVYHPVKAENVPIIMMVHGGGWRRGDKGGPSMVKNKVLHWVNNKGCVLISVNYRVVPEANPAQQGEDIGRAIAFAQSKAKTWGADPARLVLMGHSAGAHLVSLVSADGSLATRFGGRPWLATVSIDSAAFDIEAIMNRKHYGLYDTAFGSDPALWREASPMQRLKGKPAAPMLLVCSSKRSDSCPPAQEFAAKANGFGGQVKVLPVELNHAQINDQLGTDGAYTAAVDEFLKTVGIH